MLSARDSVSGASHEEGQLFHFLIVLSGLGFHLKKLACFVIASSNILLGFGQRELKTNPFRALQIDHRMLVISLCETWYVLASKHFNNHLSSRVMGMSKDCNLIFSSAHIETVQGQSKSVCSIVSSTWWHEGHQGSGKIFLLYRFSLVGRAFWQVLHRKMGILG